MTLKTFVEKHELLICGLGTGILLAAAWPPWGLPFLAFVAFVPLLKAESVLLENKNSINSLRFFRVAYLAFFVFNLLTTWWIALSTLPGVLVAVIINSLFMTLPWWLVHVWRRSSSKQGWLPLLFFWLSFEYLHAQWEVSWSWLDLGNVFATHPTWIQWYEYTGVAGGSLWILVVNLWAFSFLKELLKAKDFSGFSFKKLLQLQFPKKMALKKTTLFFSFSLVTLLTPMVVSIIIYRGYEEKIDPVEIVIVQPSENPYHRPNIGEQAVMTEKMIKLAGEKVTTETSFVLTPEAALPGTLWLHQPQINPSLQKLQSFLALNPNLLWVTGASIFEFHSSNVNLPYTSRRLGDSDSYYTIFNSALITNQIELLDFYHKSKLVPGIEAIPYANVFKPLGAVFSFFGGTAKGLGRQDSRSVFVTEDGVKVAPVICFESIFGHFITEYARLGANVIFIMTNDGWWGKTPGYRQHNHYARLRAIELRKPVARAASTGISSFIDQRGNFIQQTKWKQVTAINQSLNINDKLTYFARHGNVIGKTSLFFSALVILALLVQKTTKKQQYKR